MNPVSGSGGGKAAPTTTPANANLGHDKPGIMDEQGAIGKQFKREWPAA
jgi:hypothetical protein